MLPRQPAGTSRTAGASSPPVAEIDDRTGTPCPCRRGLPALPAVPASTPAARTIEDRRTPPRTFQGIVGVDDKPHCLADYKDAKLVVLVFTCNHCPVAQAYEDRLIALQKDYRTKGVQVVAINVNNISRRPAR